MAKAGRNTILEHHAPGFDWMHVRATGPEELSAIRRRFMLREEDLKDVPPPTQRPKIVIRDNYLFFILLFPYYDRSREEIIISEVDFFIGKDFLVTVNEADKMPAFFELINRCKRSPTQSRSICEQGPGALALGLLEQLLTHQFPMLIHVSEDIDDIELSLFDGNRHSEETIFHVLRGKNNITGFRRAAMGHKAVIERLGAEGAAAFINNDMATIRRLVDITKEVWNLLENHRETLGALHDTYVSLLSFRTNDIMRTLTIFSVIVFPLSLFAAIFGMNAHGIPFVDNPYGFWIIVGLMAIGVITMIAFFKEKKWI